MDGRTHENEKKKRASQIRLFWPKHVYSHNLHALYAK